MTRPLSRLALLVALLASVPASAQILPAYGEDRAGTAGFQFLEIAVDPRGAALGGTAVATTNDASALFWNPALSARGGRTQALAATLAYFADVSLNYAAVTQRIGTFTVGGHVQTLDSGDMAVTTEFSGPAGTGQSFRYLGVVGGVTVSQALTDLFAYGVTAKLAREAAADVAMTVPLLDLGVHYRVGTTGASIGVAIRNFGLNGEATGEIERQTVGGETVVEDEFEDLVPPTTFMLGVGYDVVRAGDHAVTVSGQLTNPNDNAEQFNVGAEYVWNDVLSLRGGYRFGVEEATTPTLGFGVEVPGLGDRTLRADYAFETYERLGPTHRIGVAVQF
ncbi:PorV/PorQ family protein [Rubrivirga sp.]|uniref:PorV/PorQ family protein n=1 Tax=Rubrivirga sp. TaxID=1885344 RepID=UPI003B523DA0